METFQEQYDRYRAAVEEALQNLFLRNKPYNRLQEAMRYSLLAGGKRVRPVMTLAFCEALGGEARRALSLGVALECVQHLSGHHAVPAAGGCKGVYRFDPLLRAQARRV